MMEMSDKEFAKYAAEQNKAYRQKMIAAGFQYWPTLDRWFPKGTEIRGAKPESAT